MQRMNHHNRLGLVDIATPGFDPSEYNRTLDDLMGTIHGVRADGTIVTGMQTFREAYSALGWGWLWAPTGWPILKPICDFGYRIFARYRVSWGRFFGRSCETGTCRIPSSENKIQK